jgi:hypothetical protein
MALTRGEGPRTVGYRITIPEAESTSYRNLIKPYLLSNQIYDV